MPEQPAHHSDPHTAPRRQADGSIRETFESIVIAFVLAFVFRAFIVEAFVIPTGSMAPTLLGAHLRDTCPQCGYELVFSPRDHDRRNDPLPVQGGDGLSDPLRFQCPMCRYPIRRERMYTNDGDRILVLKYVYAFSEPDRWDVVVFKNPKRLDQNYIKRLVGLPGEQLWIIDGNIYTRPLGPDGDPPPDATPWQVRRKPPGIQRSVWRAVYHSDYLPLDAGETGFPNSRRRETWQIPWQPPPEHDPRWEFEPRGPHWRYSDPQNRPATLSFRFGPHTAYNFYPYNLLADDHGIGDAGIEDLRLAATVRPEETAGTGLALTLSGHEKLMRARIEPDGTAVLETRPRSSTADSNGPGWTARQRAELDPLPAGRGTRVELWHVDQALSLWVGGERVLRWTYPRPRRSLHAQQLTDYVRLLPNHLQRDLRQWADRGAPEPGNRDNSTLAGAARTVLALAEPLEQNRLNRILQGDSAPEPTVRLSVRGSDATLRSVDLDRDLYYTQTQRPGDNLGTGYRPAAIEEDRFYCLGDNSPQSQDSRLWDRVNPWVRHATGVEPGFVPRDLMLGRAFFVYFPAPWRITRGSPAVIPNFGDMRFIE